VRVSAKSDYAIRALVQLAASSEERLSGKRLAEAQQIPVGFFENIMAELRRHDLVRTRRGPDGGYWLARPADQITLAEVIIAVDGGRFVTCGSPCVGLSTKSYGRRRWPMSRTGHSRTASSSCSRLPHVAPRSSVDRPPGATRTTR